MRSAGQQSGIGVVTAFFSGPVPERKAIRNSAPHRRIGSRGPASTPVPDVSEWHLAVRGCLAHRLIVDIEPGMKIVGRPQPRAPMERFDRLQATVGAVAARPLMRRGTVLRFRTFDEFEAWKRRATHDHRASRSPATS